jgi:hypothetical protein
VNGSESTPKQRYVGQGLNTTTSTAIQARSAWTALAMTPATLKYPVRTLQMGIDDSVSKYGKARVHRTMAGHVQ